MYISGSKPIIISVLVVLMVVSALNVSVYSQVIDPADTTHSFITSRFMIWDTHEKMLDDKFTIHLIDVNDTVNYTSSYMITINSNSYNGTFSDYYFKTFEVNSSSIVLLDVKINNITYLHETDIMIRTGITQQQITRIDSPFTINLLPWEWSQKEINIVIALILAFLPSLLIAYRIVKKYRKHSGHTEVK